MNITAALGTTPHAFTGATSKSSEAAAKSAAGFGAAQVQQIQAIDEQVISLLAKAASEQAGEVNTTKPQVPGKPELREANMPRLLKAAQQQAANAPGNGQSTLNSDGVLLLLTMQLANVIGEENTRSLTAQLEAIKARLAARAASAAELAEAIRLAESLAEAALGDVGAAEGELAAAMEALKKAQAEVARLEQALADALPEEQDAIRAQLEAAKAEAAKAQGPVDAAYAKLNAAMLAYNQALQDIAELNAEAEALDPNLIGGDAQQSKAYSGRAGIDYLLALLQELIAENNLRKFTKETEYVQAALKAREAENLKRAEEYQREKEKAEQAQKKMGCIGKVIGWVMTVAAVVAAPFTGGASMALAAIGLGLAIGQEFGFDPLGKVLEPVMKLMMKLVQEVAKVIGEALKAVGVDAAIVDKIKDVLAMIAVAAMVVAIAVVSKKLASTVAVQAITKAVTKAVTEAVSKALPNILKAAAHTVKNSVDDVARKISEVTAKAIKSDTSTLATRTGQATKAMHGLQLANQTSQGIGNVIIADMQVDVAKLKAALSLGLLDSQLLRELIQKILEQMLQANDLVESLFRQSSSARAQRDDTAKFITARIGRA